MSEKKSKKLSREIERISDALPKLRIITRNSEVMANHKRRIRKAYQSAGMDGVIKYLDQIAQLKRDAEKRNNDDQSVPQGDTPAV